MASTGSFYIQEMYDNKELWCLVILLYIVIFQIIPGDENYVLYILLGDNKWYCTELYDILQKPVWVANPVNIIWKF